MEFEDYEYDDLPAMMGGGDYDQLDMGMLQDLYEKDPEAFEKFYRQFMDSNSNMGGSDPVGYQYYMYLHQLRHCIEPSLQSVAQSFLPLLILCLTVNVCKYVLLSFLHHHGHEDQEHVKQENCNGSENHTMENYNNDNENKGCTITADVETENTHANVFMCIHIMMAMCGLGVTYYSFTIGSIYLLIAQLLLYLVMRFVSRESCGPVISVLCGLYLVIGEVLTWKQQQAQIWHQMRGTQMLMCMRVISLAYDMKNNIIKKLPNLGEYFGYIFCIGTVLYGPWISYSTYIASTAKGRFSLSWFKHLLLSIVSAVCCLTVSNCLTTFLTQFVSHKWAIAYFDAQSFRFSHYFICYLSQVTVAAAGIAAAHDDTEESGNGWNFHVTKPYNIEIPQSLVEVVINWNIPMHKWLKFYVFRPTKIKCGVIVGLLATYGASALLHGLSFQLAAVLFSLAWYTAVEYYMRKVLSGIFNACITARSCASNCSHRFKDSATLWVCWINYAFTAMSVYHLAYLGVMFNSDNQQETGYSMSHTLKKWRKLDYSSHKLVLYLTVLVVSIGILRNVRSRPQSSK